MQKRVLCTFMVLIIVLSCVFTGQFVSNAVTAEETESAAGSYGLADNVQDGQVLQCWNWSFNSIKNNMAKIAQQGFSAIQTSPIQQTKESINGKTMNDWWLLYQPAYFKIDTINANGLGTKAEFTAMCTEAHKYGVKVLVDAVLNHMGDNGGNNISTQVDPELRNNPSCWHNISINSSYTSRYDITQYCMNKLPDLNTANTTVQNKAIGFLKECIDCGADGFRFDGAKHIETPVDSNCASNFWPNVLSATTSHAQSTRGITPYYYGEVLNEVTGTNDRGVASKVLNSYESYMSVTVNTLSDDVCTKINSGNASAAARNDFYFMDGVQANPDKAMLWNESHDTYASGSTSGRNTTVMNKTWAVVGARSKASAMYFARPSSLNTRVGTADATGWTNAEVKAVNQFKNYFIGQSEHLTYSGNIVYNERGTSGIVLTNCSGTSTDVSVPVSKIKSGTYTDQITGNKFTVSSGRISGKIGSTGVAVVYNATPAGPSASVTPGSSTYKTDSLTLTLNYSNATSGQYSVDGSAYKTYTNGQTITIGAGKAYDTVTTVKVKASDGTSTSSEATYTYTKADPSKTPTIYFDNSSYKWSKVYVYVYNSEGTAENAEWPGVEMQYDSQTGYYKYELPESFYDGNAMFTESYSATTNRYPADQQPGLPIGGTSKILKANHVWENYTPPVPTTTPVEKVLIGDVDLDGKIAIRDATQIQFYIAHDAVFNEKMMIAADTNFDGKINIRDATNIQSYIAKVIKDGNHTGQYREI